MRGDLLRAIEFCLAAQYLPASNLAQIRHSCHTRIRI
jgi:hypothetical protein